MVIRQGDIYWVELEKPVGSGPGYRHPLVIVQNNTTNESRIRTVIACVLTSNLRLANAPGNVLLDRGEGNLPKRSVVVVSQLITVDKMRLEEWIGLLSPRRVRQIIAGISLLLEPSEVSWIAP